MPPPTPPPTTLPASVFLPLTSSPDPPEQASQLFLDSYDQFSGWLSTLATLDVLAGFAAATHPSAAPPGCAFCRPTFAAGAGSGGGSGAPPLRLEGLWNPALLASRVGASPVPNDLSLGAAGSSGCGIAGGSGGSTGRPGMLLLTGANTGGKSTLLRAACLAAVMAQVRLDDVVL